MCDVCNRGFISESRYLAHRATHHNVRYECTQCIEQFVQRAQLSEHQKVTGHLGEGIIESLEECDDKTRYDDLLKSTDLPTTSEFDTQNNDMHVEMFIEPSQTESEQPLLEEQEQQNSTDVFAQIDNVLDDMNHIEEAAKVLYGLQNIDKNDSHQQIESNNEYISSEYDNYNASPSVPVVSLSTNLT